MSPPPSPRRPHRPRNRLRHPFRALHRASPRHGWRKHLPVIGLVLIAALCAAGGYAILHTHDRSTTATTEQTTSPPTIPRRGTSQPLRPTPSSIVAEGSTTTVARATSTYCAQVTALYQIRPLLTVYYRQGNIENFRYTVRSFSEQLSYLERIAPPDVAGPTAALAQDVAKFTPVVERAKDLEPVTAWLQANLGGVIDRAAPWTAWVTTNCPSLARNGA